uniref:Uncharacterized protein n=1 Tax=Melanopsichium pennsylvanicum 4 TaxID=1398559 RepID=A0A077R771_9BASI|nr:uncharacterized protein BN887_00071 [Melanopsichium pennsylvanicum 4]
MNPSLFCVLSGKTHEASTPTLKASID